MDPNDQPGSYAKFSCPTIANGKVYLSTFSNQLVVYGLLDKSSDTCNTANVALNKPAYASSLENNTQFSASDAFDGSLATRWSSQFSDPQYIYVDLGQPYHICNVVLKWEFAYGKDFSIQVSDDAQTWNTVQSVAGNTQMISILPLNANGRYVRMYGTARGTAYGYSLYEFEVYGNPLIKNNSTAPIIYPNPAQSYLHILKGTEDILEVSVSNAAGQLIAHTLNTGNLAQIDIPMAGLAKAIYFVRVQTGVKTYQYKVLHVN